MNYVLPDGSIVTSSGLAVKSAETLTIFSGGTSIDASAVGGSGGQWAAINVSGGVASGTMLGQFGRMDVYQDGIASGTVISGTTEMHGMAYTREGGSVFDTTVNNLGYLCSGRIRFRCNGEQWRKFACETRRRGFQSDNQ